MPAKGQRTGYYINCENCGKSVYKTKTEYNKAKHHFCSNKCQKDFQHSLLFEERKCIICGKVFHVSKKSTQKLCSVECQKKWQTTQVGILNSRFMRKKIKCNSCGKMYYVKNYKIQNGQHNFCSQECRRKWYAEEWSQSEEWKEQSRIRATNILSNKKINTNTAPQIIINNLLDNMKIPYINEKNCKYYSIDNYLTDSNLMIEVMGDFWHCNPLKYTKETMRDIQKKIIPRDKAKRSYIRNIYNIEILYLWEYDIYFNLNICKLLIEKYIEQNGKLENYHSFNYHIKNDILNINENIIIPYQELNIANA